ncbi:D-aspartate oxidase [Parahypoxylon ruwenzoriense]
MTLSNTRDGIVIVGSTSPTADLRAGIIGLDVALVLAEKGYGQWITIIAEYLPGDTAVSYTSPWAGCNFSAISGTDANALRWDRLGYSHLSKLASDTPNEAFVSWTPSTEFWDENIPLEKIKDMEGYLKDFRILSKTELPERVEFGISFSTLTVNAPRHMQYIYRKLKDPYNVRFIRQKIPSIQAAFASPATKIVFNCTGNAAKTLPGVEDPKCYPTRGQIVLARAPHVRSNVMRHGEDYETYIIPRPGSNGNVILGGYMQEGNSDGATYSYEAESILERTKALCSELRQADLEILANFTGLRPSRKGGARVEKEDLLVTGEKRTLVHNYGAGGTGFQAGYGMAVDAVEMVTDILRDVLENII